MLQPSESLRERLGWEITSRLMGALAEMGSGVVVPGDATLSEALAGANRRVRETGLLAGLADAVLDPLNYLRVGDWRTMKWCMDGGCNEVIGELGEFLAPFRTKGCSVAHRAVDSEAFQAKLLRNGVRAYIDSVACRIVPALPERFVEVLEAVEQSGYVDALLLNTFRFQRNDFAKYIGPTSSPNYRAVHYVLRVRGVPVELQVRTPTVDLWATVHHITGYKVSINVTAEDEQFVDVLGRVAVHRDCLAVASSN